MKYSKVHKNPDIFALNYRYSTICGNYMDISKMALLKFQFTDLNKYIFMYKEFIDKAQLMKLKKKKYAYKYTDSYNVRSCQCIV